MAPLILSMFCKSFTAAQVASTHRWQRWLSAFDGTVNVNFVPLVHFTPTPSPSRVSFPQRLQV
jgi:hypothetical protein